jgi:hypothetical protein
MTSPNTVQFTDLKVTLVPGSGGATIPLSEESIPDDHPFQVVAEVEAGETVFNVQQPDFHILAVVTDKTTGTVVATPSASGRVGQNGGWTSQSASITLTPSIPKQGTTKDDHLYEVSAVLSLGQGILTLSLLLRTCGLLLPGHCKECLVLQAKRERHLFRCLFLLYLCASW